MTRAIQDCYPAQYAHCYGCGHENKAGYRLKSFLRGDVTEARHTPGIQYSGGVPGHVYGGMIASLMDCHGMASAAAFMYRERGGNIENEIDPARYVTASLKVDFKRPTPQGVELLVRGELLSVEGRKVRIALSLLAGDEVCATGEILAIELRGAGEAQTRAQEAQGRSLLHGSGQQLLAGLI